MKRPLMIIGFSMFISLAVFSYLDSTAILAVFIPMAVLLPMAFLLSFKAQIKSIVLISTGILLAAGQLLIINIFVSDAAKNYDGTVSLKGYITRTEDSGCVLKTEIDGKSVNIFINSYENMSFYSGDGVYLETELFHVDEADSSYLRTKCKAYNCFLYAKTPEVMRYDDSVIVKNPVERFFYQMRIRLLKAQEEIFSDDSLGFINAVTLGERRTLSEDIEFSFKRAGLSHVLVISGMHLSILASAVFTLLRKFGKRKAAVCAVFFTLAYMALTGFSPSVTRAGIMTIIMFISLTAGENYDGLTALGAACFIMCLNNPYCAADISLQLSVVSTAGILVIFPPVRGLLWNLVKDKSKRKIVRLLIKLSDILLISLSANIALLPFYVFVFGTISLVAPLANIAASLLMPCIIVVSLIATLLAVLPVVSCLAFIPAFAADAMIGCLVKNAGWFADFKYATVSADYTFMHIWIIATALLFAYAAYARKGKAYVQAAALSIIVLFASTLCYNINVGDRIKIKEIPIGENGCFVINYKNHTALICELENKSSWYKLENALSDDAVNKIDLMIAPNCNSSNSLLEFADRYSVKNIVTDDWLVLSKTGDDLKAHGVNTYSVFENSEISFGERVKFSLRNKENGRNFLISADDVLFNINFGEYDLLEDFELYKDIDVAFIGEAKPYGLDYTNLSYVVFTSEDTERQMYMRTMHYTENFAFSNTSVTFFVKGNGFYTVKGGSRQ